MSDWKFKTYEFFPQAPHGWPQSPDNHRGEKRLEWHPAALLGNGGVGEPYGYPFRTCAFCGSMHPEDVVFWVNHGATMHCADWKYGWPHKFYIEKIPNPLFGNKYKVFTFTRTPPKGEEGWERIDDGSNVSYRRVHSEQPSPPYVTSKFYSTHIGDTMTEEAREKLTSVLLFHGGIQFKRDPKTGNLQYTRVATATSQ